MADLLRQGPDVAPSFLNSVLNQLNWAFSEFIGMIQEVSDAGQVAQPAGDKSELTPARPPVGGTDSAGCRAPGAELRGQPAAQGLCHLL